MRSDLKVRDLADRVQLGDRQDDLLRACAVGLIPHKRQVDSPLVKPDGGVGNAGRERLGQQDDPRIDELVRD